MEEYTTVRAGSNWPGVLTVAAVRVSGFVAVLIGDVAKTLGGPFAWRSPIEWVISKEETGSGSRGGCLASSTTVLTVFRAQLLQQNIFQDPSLPLRAPCWSYIAVQVQWRLQCITKTLDFLVITQ